MGILGGTKQDVATKLDAQIDIELNFLNTQRSVDADPALPRASVGTNGDYWSPGVISRALEKDYMTHTFTPVDLDTDWRRSDCFYLVDGVLNQTYTHVHPDRTHEQYTHEDDGTSWRHSIMLHPKKKFYCQFFGETVDDDCLWLTSDHRPTKLGYMKEFHTVFQVEVGDAKYCLCKKPCFGSMILCDACDCWYHIKCVGIEVSDVVEIYVCDQCTFKGI
jgi:hypothetical protein